MVRGLEPGKRTALIVNEMQNAIANPAYIDTPLAGQVAERGVVARINTLTAAFRVAGAPVIFCTIAARTPNWDGFVVNCALAARIKRTGKLVAGTADAAIHDDLVVEPPDIVSQRAHGMAPFTGTTLDATAETHQMQVTMHLPLLATVTDGASVTASLGADI